MDYETLGTEYAHRFGGEVRQVEDSADAFVLTGLAAVFNQWAEIGPFRERIAPGAFREALKTSDVRLLVNHAGLPFARTTSGTMDLRETDKGLEMEARLSKADPEVRALVPKIERGDLSQFSFAFDVGSAGQSWDGDERTISQFSELFDVSLVTFPAFEATKVTALRSWQRYQRSMGVTNERLTALRRAMLIRYW